MMHSANQQESERKQPTIIETINTDLLALCEYVREHPELKQKLTDPETEKNLTTVLNTYVSLQIDHNYMASPATDAAERRRDISMLRLDNDTSWRQVFSDITAACLGGVGSDNLYTRNGSVYSIVVNNKNVKGDTSGIVVSSHKIKDQQAYFIPMGIIDAYIQKGIDHSTVYNQAANDGYLCSYKLNQQNLNGVSYICGRKNGLGYMCDHILPKYHIKNAHLIYGRTVGVPTTYAIQLDEVQTQIFHGLFTNTKTEESRQFFNDIQLTSRLDDHTQSTSSSRTTESPKGDGEQSHENSLEGDLAAGRNEWLQNLDNDTDKRSLDALNKTTANMYQTLVNFRMTSSVDLGIELSPVVRSKSEYMWFAYINAITDYACALFALFIDKINIVQCHVGVKPNEYKFKLVQLNTMLYKSILSQISIQFRTRSDIGKKINALLSKLNSFYGSLANLIETAYSSFKCDEVTPTTLDADRSVIQRIINPPRLNANRVNMDLPKTKPESRFSTGDMTDEQLAMLLDM